MIYKYFGMPKNLVYNNIYSEITNTRTGEKLNAHKKFFTKIGLNYLTLGISAIILQIIIINIINPDYLTDINIITVISSLCNYILPFPLFYWLMKKLDKTRMDVLLVILELSGLMSITWKAKSGINFWSKMYWFLWSL